MDKPSAPTPANRRNFITSFTLLLLGCRALLRSPASYAQITTGLLSASAEQQFHHIATFLSARPDLNAELSNKAFNELKAYLPEFDTQLSFFTHLLTDLDAVEKTLTQIQSCTSQPQQHECLISEKTKHFAEFVQLILRALYTGRIGQGAHARLVTYEQALMFTSTKDVTVIPSYARGGYAYWTQPL